MKKKYWRTMKWKRHNKKIVGKNATKLENVRWLEEDDKEYNQKPGDKKKLHIII